MSFLTRVEINSKDLMAMNMNAHELFQDKKKYISKFLIRFLCDPFKVKNDMNRHV